MKKLLVIAMSLMMTANLVACGGGGTSSSSSDTSTSTVTQSQDTVAQNDTSADDTNADAEYTDEQIALASDFAAAEDAYNDIIDRINEHSELLEDEEMVDSVNQLTDLINEADSLFEDPANLTDDAMSALRETMDAIYQFIDEAEAELDNYDAADESVDELTVSVTIQNNTGVDIYGLCMSPSNTDDWGDNLIEEVIADGEAAQGDFTFTADTLIWDLLIEDAEGSQVTFAGVDFSEASTDGAQLILSEENGEFYAEVQ